MHILLVEDHYPDIVLVRKAFERCTLSGKIHTVRNGDEALSFLRKENGFEDAVYPDMILLDINLPKKSGYEVLQEIRSDRQFEDIPVVMLTSSEAEQDIQKSYSLQANSYLVKPCCFKDYTKVVKCIESFWNRIVAIYKQP